MDGTGGAQRTKYKGRRRQRESFVARQLEDAPNVRACMNIFHASWGDANKNSRVAKDTIRRRDNTITRMTIVICVIIITVYRYKSEKEFFFIIIILPRPAARVPLLGCAGPAADGRGGGGRPIAPRARYGYK